MTATMMRGEIRKCIACGQLKGGDGFINKRYKTCTDYVCADLRRKPGTGGRPPTPAEPAANAEPQVEEAARKPPRPAGRPPLLRIPKSEGLPSKWV